jgi:hypothetical protein
LVGVTVITGAGAVVLAVAEASAERALLKSETRESVMLMPDCRYLSAACRAV